MTLTFRALLIAIATTLMLAASVGIASANALSVDEVDFRLSWTNLTIDSAGVDIECAVTLRGSFHDSSFAKSSRALVGSITHAIVNEGSCVGGVVDPLEETLPWHVTYTGFGGSLPGISSLTVDIVGWAMFTDSTADCLWLTTSAEPLRGIANIEGSGTITSFNADETRSIDLENEFCELIGNSSFSGNASFVAADGSPITLDLTSSDRNPAVLRSDQSNVVITELEASDRFTVTNEGTDPAETATIDAIEDEGADEFSVSSTGCSGRLADSASCVYTITVNERPLASGRITISYDDGVNGEVRRLSIEVDIANITDRLRASPSSVTIDALEQNDIVTVLNDGASAVTVSRVVVETFDRERPEFEATSPGCRSTINVGESCTYIIRVNERPEDDGRITIYFRGAGGEGTTSIPIDIAEDPAPADLRATPTSVTIERLEANDSFVLRNEGAGSASAIIDRSTLVSDDRERPEFSVTGIGCTEIFLDGASCTYIVSVNARPEGDGRYVIEYDDGTGTETIRSVTVEVDIAS